MWHQAIISGATPAERQLCIAFCGHDFHLNEQECTLPFYDGRQLVHIPLCDVIYFTSCDKYCLVYCVRNRAVQKLMALTGNLGYYERLLSGRGFFRCHRQYLFQYRHFVRRLPHLQLELSYQRIVDLAKRKRGNFKVFQLTVAAPVLTVMEVALWCCMAMGLE